MGDFKLLGALPGTAMGDFKLLGAPGAFTGLAAWGGSVKSRSLFKPKNHLEVVATPTSYNNNNNKKKKKKKKKNNKNNHNNSDNHGMWEDEIAPDNISNDLYLCILRYVNSLTRLSHVVW